MSELERKYRQAPITFCVIALCVGVYVVSVLLFGIEMNGQQALSFGGYNPLYVYFYNEYYRLITANFIHFGLFHIVVNCYSLYGIGSFIESVLKVKKYVIVLVMSGLATTLLPYLLFLLNGFEMNVVGGGISGVIFGLIGSLGALALKYKDIFMPIFKQLAINVLLMLLISVVVPSISLSGHVSGFIGGFVTTYILLNVNRHKNNRYDDLVN